MTMKKFSFFAQETIIIDRIEYWRVKDLDENPSTSPLLQIGKKIYLLLNNLH